MKALRINSTETHQSASTYKGAHQVYVGGNGMKADEIRQSFFNFFASKQHAVVPVLRWVLPIHLTFTNAGMNQFKSFLGRVK